MSKIIYTKVLKLIKVFLCLISCGGILDFFNYSSNIPYLKYAAIPSILILILSRNYISKHSLEENNRILKKEKTKLENNESEFFMESFFKFYIVEIIGFSIMFFDISLDFKYNLFEFILLFIGITWFYNSLEANKEKFLKDTFNISKRF